MSIWILCWGTAIGAKFGPLTKNYIALWAHTRVLPFFAAFLLHNTVHILLHPWCHAVPMMGNNANNTGWGTYFCQVSHRRTSIWRVCCRRRGRRNGCTWPHWTAGNTWRKENNDQQQYAACCHAEQNPSCIRRTTDPDWREHSEKAIQHPLSDKAMMMITKWLRFQAQNSYTKSLPWHRNRISKQTVAQSFVDHDHSISRDDRLGNMTSERLLVIKSPPKHKWATNETTSHWFEKVHTLFFLNPCHIGNVSLIWMLWLVARSQLEHIRCPEAIVSMWGEKSHSIASEAIQTRREWTLRYSAYFRSQF